MKKTEQNLINILQFVNEYIKNNSFPPSYREIAKAVNLKSTSSVKSYLDILQERNLINKQTYKNRCLEVNDSKKTKTISCPIVGRVAAGVPILAEQNIEDYISLSVSLFNVSETDKIFALKIYGESMIEKGINNGDYAIVYSQNDAENGDIIVAMLEDKCTVKTFYRLQDGKYKLQPANQLYNPIIVENLTILGKVIGIIRKI